MSEANLAFQEWKKKWNKKYDSFSEENTRFGDFRINFYDEIKYSDDPPESIPLWDVLNEYADRPFKEHFGYIRLDRNAGSEEGEVPEGLISGFLFPVKQKDGTITREWSVIKSAVALPVKRPSSSDDNKDDTKEEDLDDATLRRPKIGLQGGSQCLKPMSEANVAFQEWKKKWNKKYDSFSEENTRFGDFRINFYDEIKYSDDPPETKPLWDVLNEYADRPFKEHFGYIRLDRNAGSEEGDLPEGLISGCMFPVKQKDGTITMEWSEIKSDDNKDDTKEEDLDDATLKRPKIGCGGQKPGCCTSDCGK